MKVPGMSSTLSARASSQASPTWLVVAPSRAATARAAGSSLTFGIPGKAEPSGKKGT